MQVHHPTRERNSDLIVGRTVANRPLEEERGKGMEQDITLSVGSYPRGVCPITCRPYNAVSSYVSASMSFDTLTSSLVPFFIPHNKYVKTTFLYVYRLRTKTSIQRKNAKQKKTLVFFF
jgi:hypothetical protein